MSILVHRRPWDTASTSEVVGPLVTLVLCPDFPVPDDGVAIYRDPSGLGGPEALIDTGRARSAINPVQAGLLLFREQDGLLVGTAGIRLEDGDGAPLIAVARFAMTAESPPPGLRHTAWLGRDFLRRFRFTYDADNLEFSLALNTEREGVVDRR